MNFFHKVYLEVKSFFKKLFSSGDEISAKRVVGFSSFFCMFLSQVVYYCSKQHLIIPEFMWWGFLALVSACFALNVVESLAKLKAKFNIASDMISKEPSMENSDNAKETLQSTKP